MRFWPSQQQVMDTVQNFASEGVCRRQSTSNEQIRVDQQGQSIVVEPANPQVNLCSLLQPDGDLRAVVVAGIPASLLGSLAGLFHRSGYRGGFRVGIGISVGPGFFFGTFQTGRIATSPLST